MHASANARQLQHSEQAAHSAADEAEIETMTQNRHLEAAKRSCNKGWRAGSVRGAWLIVLALLPFLVVCAGAYAISEPIVLANTGAWSGAPQVAADGAGHWAAIWEGGGIGTDTDIFVSYSDTGGTWTAPVALNTNAATDSGDDRNPNIAYANGHWVVVWESYDSLGGTIGTEGDILVAYGSISGGIWTWTDPVALNAGAATDTILDRDPQLAADGAGHWMCVWKRGVSADTLDNFDIVTSPGTVAGDTWTWTPPTVLDTGLICPDGDVTTVSVAGGNGAWVVIWDPPVSYYNSATVFSRSTDNGATWSALAPVDNTPGESFYDWGLNVTTDGAGNWVATWIAHDISDNGFVVFSRSTDNGATWSNPTKLDPSYDPVWSSVYTPCVLSDRNGRWVVLWQVQAYLTGPGLLMSQSFDAGATWTSPALFPNTGYPYVPQLGTDGSGHWVGIWSAYPVDSYEVRASYFAMRIDGDISTIEDLQAIESNPSGHYVLTNDINASVTSGWNAGAGFAPITYFTGTFDGNGHTISNLYINRGDQICVGLFGTISGATIQNVALTAVNVTGPATGQSVTGALVGYTSAGSNVVRCSSSGTVTGFNYVGGLIGESIYTNIVECQTGGTVRSTGGEYSGGLSGVVWGSDVGASSTSSILRCASFADVTGSADISGGLVGSVGATDVYDCYARGAVTVDQLVAGGLIGAISNDGHTIARCYSTGAPSGVDRLGGLIGYGDGGTVTSCYWDKQTSGINTSNGGTGLSSEGMYQLLSDFDYTTPIWNNRDRMSYSELAVFMAPTPYITRAAGQATRTKSPPILFDVVFRQPLWSLPGIDMSDFDESDVVFTGTATATAYSVTKVGSGVYRLAVTGVNGLDSGLATVIPTLPANVCITTIVDMSGVSTNNASVSLNNVVEYAVPPEVVNITREAGACSHIRSLSATFTVTFSQPVNGVDASDFSVTNPSMVSSNTPVLSISPATGPSATYAVTVDTGAGVGEIIIDLVDDDSITDVDGLKLGDVGWGNGSFTNGETYYVDKTALTLGQEIPVPAGYMVPLGANISWTPPDAVEVRGGKYYVIANGAFTMRWALQDIDTHAWAFFCQEMATSVSVQSIRRNTPVLTHNRDDEVVFKVQFTEAVTGVDATDFSLANSGMTGPAVTTIDAIDAATYLVTVNTGAGRGLLELDVVDDNSIHDMVGNPLGGLTLHDALADPPVAGDGDYSTGQRYAIDKTVYRIGDAIPFPLELEFFSPAQLALGDTTSIPVKTMFPPTPSHPDLVAVEVRNLFFVESAAMTGEYSGLFVGDALAVNPHAKGYTTITWSYDDGMPPLQTFQQDILIDPDTSHTAHQAMRVYFTDVAGLTTNAAKVSLLTTDIVGIHHNSRIWPDYEPNPTTGAGKIQYLWLDAPIAALKDLRARQCTGFVVLHFEDAGLNFLGVQVVEVRPYAKDYATMTCDLGYEPTPHDTVPEAYVSWPPYVARGKVLADESTSYVYQHGVAEAAQYGNVYAIKKTTKDDQVEIFWMRLSEGTTPAVQSLDIKWPYEMARYTFNWPTDPAKYQRYVRGHTPGPIGVAVPITNTATSTADVMPYTEFQTGFSVTKKPGANGAFETDGPGWALVRYQTGSPPGKDNVAFTVVRSVYHDDVSFFPVTTPSEWPIGTEVMDPYHTPNPYHSYIHEVGGNLTKVSGTPGYLYIVPNSTPALVENRYDWEAYDGNNGVAAVVSEDATGQIFAVNTGTFEVWWYNKDAQGTPWPSIAKHYQAKWPNTIADLSPWPGTTTDRIVISSALGTGMIPYNISKLYYQNDPARPGYNPNDEHAVTMSSIIFPLRDDLGTPATSLPYVLVRHRHPDTTALWRYTVYEVKEEGVDPRTTINYTFTYPGTAGTLVQPPMPLSAMQNYPNNLSIPVPGYTDRAWQDRNRNYWVRAAGDTGGSAQIVMRYWYPVNAEFYWPDIPHTRSGFVPWLDKRVGGTVGTPVNITYNVNWPASVPTLKGGETLVKAKLGLPAIDGRVSANILYQQATALVPSNSSVKLIDYKRTRPVNPPASSAVFISADKIPSTIETQFMQGMTFFPKLSPALKPRVVYDAINGRLGFRGFFVEPTLGDYYVFLNVMSLTDKAEMRALSTVPAWTNATDALYSACQNVIEVPANSTDFEALALTAGFATAGGYVTLAFEDAASAAPLPVSLEIIKVVEEYATGEVAAVYADCAFDERLILMHKGDFNGKPEEYQFEWRTLPDTDGIPPALPKEQWNVFTPTPATGIGARSIMIGGPGIFTLSDNWFTCHYRKKPVGKAMPTAWTNWTEPQLAEGWIKRVVGQINPFTQRASGGGIEGAEVAFSSFANNQVNTVVSMISQAGPRWGGDVPMNCLNLDDFGLIEIYETVFGRGIELSIDGTPPVKDYEPANKALLLVAGRVADLYMLLGNEAYADAADPTIAYGTEDGTYGTESTSIHCFMNMTSSLIEEELALLHGRDNALMPRVSTPPVYNRLVWNFTGDITGGEVAYALNYNIQDQNGNVDGTISEADAKKMYPQGHGDAWGHYLSAIMRYYTLLRHPNYAWVPRAEAVMVGGVPVTVDYLDERKFAKAAAARAHTGSEITSLTYRSKYTEDPAGQWQGYQDTDPDRAWGVSDWATRAGMGAYFDWVVGNAILPPVDDNPAHSGIQKIDRTTVTELREVAAAYGQIEAEIRKADMGLNPLGLAKDVVPFDFDPTGTLGETRVGFTHFEQVYEKAVKALGNAVTVFDHANNCTQLLRRQADSTTGFQKTVADQEADFNNRLIESFGYPYSDDIGPTGTYPTGYNGPDLYHYDIVETSAILGTDTGATQPFTLSLSETYVKADGGLRNPAAIAVASRTADDLAHTKTVTFHLSKLGFGIVKNPNWTGQRRAPGEIQLSHSDLLQAIGSFKSGQKEYDNLILEIKEQVNVVTDKTNKNATQLGILGSKLGVTIGLNMAILAADITGTICHRIGSELDETAQIVSDCLPKILGFEAGLACGTTIDVGSPIGGAAKGATKAASLPFNIAGDIADMAKTGLEQAKEISDLSFEMALVDLDGKEEVGVEERELLSKIREEAVKRIELYTLIEAAQQASGRYLAALASGQRLLDDRLRFRQQTAGDVQNYRYKDMAFRVFRNDALQQYRAQFDLAARYVYLAAKAYDYETNMLGSDTMAGQQFLSNIVRSRSLGVFQDGQPQTGGADPGLSDTMAKMWLNFDLVLRGRLGFNNAQNEVNRFSLREELFRTVNDPNITTDDDKWRATLGAHVVANIFDVPEFQRYCRPFSPALPQEPGIVIPFSTCVEFGMNFFGWPLAGGDSSYDSSNFDTKIRSMGVWFSGYNGLAGGMSNTPRVYLVPVGEDVMRSPTGDGTTTRKWTVLEQALPVPFPIGSGDLNNAGWIPQVDTLQEVFANMRRHSSFLAYHDSDDQFKPTEGTADGRLIGRSVWNTRWLLIIPAGTLSSDRQEGLAQFINGPEVGGVRTGEGVSDILICFETYAYSGGKKAAKTSIPSALPVQKQ